MINNNYLSRQLRQIVKKKVSVLKSQEKILTIGNGFSLNKESFI